MVLEDGGDQRQMGCLSRTRLSSSRESEPIYSVSNMSDGGQGDGRKARRAWCLGSQGRSSKSWEEGEINHEE